MLGMKKRLLFLIASFAIITSAFACKVTNMCVRQTDGTIVKYDIEKVEEVYYEDIDIPSTPSEPEKEEPETNIPEVNPSNPGQVTPQFRYFVISETEAEVIGLNVGSTNIIVPSSTIIDGREYKITSIGDNAFENLRRIETVTLPNTITNIGTEAFKGCSYLYDINIPSKASISDNAFVECQNLTFVHFGNELTKIGNGAFMGCKYLYDITIPSGVKNIGDNAFLGCYDLKTASLPESVTYIGTNAFSGCNNLEIKINNKSENVKVGANALKDCKKVVYLKDIIPEIVDAKTSDFIFKTTSDTTAKIVAYKGSKSDVIVPEFVNIEGRKYTVTRIEDGCFDKVSNEGMPSIKTLILPNTLQAIGCFAFQGCSIDTLHIPASVCIIDEYSFNSTGGTVVIDPKNPYIYYDSIKKQYLSIVEDCTTRNPLYEHIILSDSTAKITKYKNFSQSNTDIKVPEMLYIDGKIYTVVSIGEFAFSENNIIKQVKLPNTIKEIEESAFSSCKNLEIIEIPGVNYIGFAAFSGCSSLKKISLPNDVYVMEFTFSGCDALTELTIPSNCTFNMDAFYGCSNLNLNIDDWQENYELYEPIAYEYISSQCKSVTFLHKDSAIVDINYPDFEFSAMSDTTVKVLNYKGTDLDITIPSRVTIDGKTYNVTRIGSRTFSSLKIKNVNIPNSIVEIGHSAFGGCVNLRSIFIPSSVTFIGDYAFYLDEFEGSGREFTIDNYYGKVDIGHWGLYYYSLIKYKDKTLNW